MAMFGLWDGFMAMMSRGGLVMWPLLGLSLVAVALLVERSWFFLATNRPGRLRRLEEVSRLLRKREYEKARAMVAEDGSVYGELVRRLLAERPAGEAAMAEAMQAQQRRLERFLPTLSTIITAAPMLGILGTVLGIIASFEVLAGGGAAAADPRAVGQGIAEALLTTAAGLVIAVVALFPYNALRAQVNRTLGRIETLAAALGEPAETGTAAEDAAPRSVTVGDEQ